SRLCLVGGELCIRDRRDTAHSAVTQHPRSTQPHVGGGQPAAEATASPYKGIGAKFDKFFGIAKNKSKFSTELFAGITTFLAMAYILTVNPNQIIGTTESPLWASVFLATALGAVIGTLLMALVAKMPLAQAPGMGLNAALGGIVGGWTYGKSFSFGTAMLMVLISGVLFLLLTVIPCGVDKQTGRLIGIREKIFEAIPKGIRVAIPVGIGLFIAYIGFQNSGFIVSNPYTQVDLVSFTTWTKGAPAYTAVVAMVSLFSIAILSHFKVKGSVILGILIATIVAMPMGVANFDIIQGQTAGVTWKFWENFKNFFSMKTEEGGAFLAAFHDIKFPSGSVLTVIVIVLSFCMIDMFDTMGTVLGCCSKANLLDENGKPLRFNRIMMSDAIATCAGAVLGTSTVTTFVESGTGVAAGGRTGFTALTTSLLFLLSIFVLPIFAFIPSAAAAGALIYVGVLMMSNVKNIDFSDLRVAVPAFLTIILMPLAYSITDGIGIGMISYVLINIVCYVVDLIKYAATKNKEGAVAVKPKWNISVVLAIITVLFALYFFLPASV
ncbi:MAG: NCS2 family permease, partial [Clostridiales bacterium]|nr:NCS2 family permease [Clostridiales bacterium]